LPRTREVGIIRGLALWSRTGVLSHFKEAVTMVHCVRWIFPVLLAGCFAAVTSAGGSEKAARFFPVKDEGEFFKDLSKPNQIIREVQERHHKEVLVHTHRAVKTEDRDKVEKMTPDERAKYFLDWAKNEAKEQRLNGVGILICKRPQGKFNVAIVVNDKTAASFTQADERKLRDLLEKNFAA